MCAEVSVAAPVWVQATTVASLFFVFLVSLYFARQFRGTAFVLTFFPALDLLMDVLYILVSPFATAGLFAGAVVFVLAPNAVFMWLLFEKKAQPSGCMVRPSAVWTLLQRTYQPTTHACHAVDSIPEDGGWFFEDSSVMWLGWTHVHPSPDSTIPQCLPDCWGSANDVIATPEISSPSPPNSPPITPTEPSEQTSFLARFLPGWPVIRFGSGLRRLPSSTKASNLLNLGFFLLTWVVYIAAQLVWLVIWAAVNFAFPVLWVMFGCYLFQTKCMGVEYVYSIWFRVFTGGSKHHRESERFNGELMNQSLLAEVFLESIPQIVIQVINNILLGKWDGIAILSATSTIIMIVNTLYSFFYSIVVDGKKFSEIPVTFFGIEVVPPTVTSNRIEMVTGPRKGSSPAPPPINDI